MATGPLLSLFCVILACTGLPAGALAAELGEARVASHIGQQLVADIELTALQGEAAPAQVRLASADIYRGAGIAVPPVLSGLNFSVTRRGARQFVRVTSLGKVQSEYLHLYLELTEGSERVVRLATLWLTPDPNPAPAPAAAPVAPPPVPEPKPAAKVAPQPETKPAPVAETKPAPGPGHAPKPEPVHGPVAVRVAKAEPAHGAVAARAPRPEPAHGPVAVRVPKPAPAHGSVAARAPRPAPALGSIAVPAPKPAPVPVAPAKPVLKPVPAPHAQAVRASTAAAARVPVAAARVMPLPAPALPAASNPASCPRPNPALLKTCVALDYKNEQLTAQIGHLEDKVKVLQLAIGASPAAVAARPPAARPVAATAGLVPHVPKPMKTVPPPEPDFPWWWLALGGVVLVAGAGVAFFVRWRKAAQERKAQALKAASPPVMGGVKNRLMPGKGADQGGDASADSARE